MSQTIDRDQRRGAVDTLRDTFMADPELTVRRVDGLFSLNERADRNINAFSGLVNNGLVPIIYGNHQSLYDGRIVSSLNLKVRNGVPAEKLQGFYLPVAPTIASGDQGQSVQEINDLFAYLYKREGVDIVTIIRPKDKEVGVQGFSANAYKEMLRAPEAHKGLIIFPEGTLQGGRRGDGGEINGMQQVDELNILSRFLKKWQETGCVLLPVGINGSHRILNPEDGTVPDNVIDKITGKSELNPVAGATVGEPFVIDQSNIGDTTMDGLMRRLVPLLPPEAQGYYADAA